MASNFNHPFTPYDIQLQFMKHLYECIEHGNVGIFESPTGTGKSLSLICGALSWLRDHKRAAFLDSIDDASVEGEPDWIIEAYKREKRRDALDKRRSLEERLARVRAHEAKLKRELEDQSSDIRRKRRKVAEGQKSKSNAIEDSGDEFELEAYDSADDGPASSISKAQSRTGEILSSETLSLLEKLRGPTSAADESVPEEGVQIYYTSRTHSQLTQFAHELRRVKLPPSIPDEDEAEDSCVKTHETLRHVPLGSRKTLCVNPKVASLNNPTAINERCLELQRPGTAAEHRCPYLPSKDDEALVNEFRDHTLAKVRDIEDIGKLGKKMGLCPYYASRSALPQSEIITLPYPLLLQKTAREALNISLKDHVIIIDEAHNLIDAISNIFTTSVSMSQLQTALGQLTAYARRYQNRLAGKNRMYITQVIRLVQSLAAYLRGVLEQQGAKDGVARLSDLMVGKGVDLINPHKLSRYLHESKLARKVDGLVEHEAKKASKDKGGGEHRPSQRSTMPVLFQIQSFIISLMNPSKEGKLFYEKGQDGDVLLRYLLLDPTEHFREVVEDARAVILAGGTMSPMDEYRDYLFSYLPEGRLKTFSFGHVIPPENLSAVTMSNGILGSEFDFTFEKRRSEPLILDLGRTIAHLCQTIPDGVVAFFPSYDYLNQVLATWKKPISPARPAETVLANIEKHKPVFYEPEDRTGTTSTDDVLQRYSTSVHQGKGGLLLSVMGGKLSEGINFSDALGRGVLVVGLPFPNIRSAVWQAKIQHVERKAYERCLKEGSVVSDENARKASAKAAGRNLYENACMRTVNQCVGRAIRHKDDYAAIVMLDRRYASERIRGKLPGWIRGAIVGQQSVQQATAGLKRFFENKRASN